MQVGQIAVTPIADGTFVARPSYFDAHAPADARPDLFDRNGVAWLPIGCFLVCVNETTILVDAGLGPAASQLPDGMMLVGGQLFAGLHALGVEANAIDAVICTHLHSDHVGWLFDLDAEPLFPKATIWTGRADLEAVLGGDLDSADHIRRGLELAVETPRIKPMVETVEIARGVVAHPSPGHTLGHFHIEVSSEREKLVLVGDAITCPVQLDEPSWHSYGDVDPGLGFASRQEIWTALRDGTTSAVGAHFPGLQPGKLTHDGTVWVTESPNLTRTVPIVEPG